MNIKKHITFNNFTTVLLVGLIAGIIFVPEFKATLLKGIMKTGLFNPSVGKETSKPSQISELNLVFSDAAGSQLTTQDLQGKVLFINFWATWCPPCIAEMQSINDLYLRYKNNPNIQFLMVDADNDFVKSVAFMQKKSFSLPVHNLTGQVPNHWYSGSLPTTLVIDRSGNIVYSKTGAANYNSSAFTGYIDKLLAP